jgi:hypothetical protein
MRTAGGDPPRARDESLGDRRVVSAPPGGAADAGVPGEGAPGVGVPGEGVPGDGAPEVRAARSSSLSGVNGVGSSARSSAT